MSADTDHDLVAEVAGFAASAEPSAYIDRHVLDVGDTGSPDPALISAACAVAMKLARAWSAQRAEVHRTFGVLVSAPVVIIDDAWLRGEANAPPPHVYISMARDQPTLDTHWHPVGGRCDSSGHAAIDALLSPPVRLSRGPGAFDDESSGAWTLEPVL